MLNAIDLRDHIICQVLEHWRKAIARGREIQGRDVEVDTLISYLRDSHNTEFFTLYGDTGSGKTALMAKILLEVKEKYMPAQGIPCQHVESCNP